MNSKKSLLFSAALSGILVSGTGCPNDPTKTPEKADVTGAQAKHACKGLNGCKGGGADGKNECAQKGSCASADWKHDCKTKNACKGQGGCKSDGNACTGKNACKGKGGCAVPKKS